MGVVRAAYFDLDKTVIAKASIAAFGRPFRRGGLISRRTVVRAITTELLYLHFGADEHRLTKIREAMLTLTRGWDREQVREIVRESLLETIEPVIYAEALELIEEHRRAGDRVYLVSASPEEIVEPLTEMLGVDGAICTHAEIDEAGKYTGVMAFYAYGESKALAMRELAARVGIDLAESYAYSDSATDLPMLEAVGHPVVVNPDRALARIAKDRDWEVRQFTKPVRLRDRVTVATPVVTTSLALVGAAVLLWRRGHRSRLATTPVA
jgi:HAD superfamily hydrolase (TIGR01490 family)